MDREQRWNCDQHERCPESADPDAPMILCNSTIICTPKTLGLSQIMVCLECECYKTFTVLFIIIGSGLSYLLFGKCLKCVVLHSSVMKQRFGLF